MTIMFAVGGQSGAVSLPLPIARVVNNNNKKIVKNLSSIDVYDSAKFDKQRQ